MDASLASGILESTVAMAVPLLLAAEGELLVERAGVINVGLEGMLLVGAFAAMAVTYATASPLAGVSAALVTGMLLAGGFAWAVAVAGANQVVAGIALNLLALGLTGVAYRALFGVTGAALTVAPVARWPLPGLSGLPVIGPAFFAQTWIGYVAFAIVPLLAWGMYRTVTGVRLRMVGEDPVAAAAQGVQVGRVRFLAILGCGALAAIGGAYLSVAYAHTFVEGMSAGRGFIALAIVIFGRWSASGILLASLLFGFATALQFHVQALGLPIPYQALLALPYVLTLLALAAGGAAARGPAALGAGGDEG
ncbi:ABC transporter permease [Candidatus Binatia bacterium]|nr:ABC transporter permease [Candidatus Binatia bacterium]